MKNLGIFITAEERDQIDEAQEGSDYYCSVLSCEARLSEPQASVCRLVDKYKLPRTTLLEVSTGEFLSREE